MPFTLPFPLEVESKLVFLIVLPTSTLKKLEENRHRVENEREAMTNSNPPIPVFIGCFDGGSRRRRGGWDGGCWVVQTYDSNQLLALGRNKNKKEKEKN